MGVKYACLLAFLTHLKTDLLRENRRATNEVTDIRLEVW